ncbi:MAG: hypothetical protein ACI4Q7_04625 [Candidatus Avelusimicrobium sp.]
MKTLFDLMQRHRLLAPEPDDHTDAGSAGGADQGNSLDTGFRDHARNDGGEKGKNILSGVDSRLQPSGMTLEDPTDKAGQDGPAAKTADKDATKNGPDGLDTLAGVEGFEYAEGEIDELKALCKEHSLPAEAAKAVLDWQAKFAKVADEKRAADLQGEMTEFVRNESEKNFHLVRKEWGTDPAAVAENEAAVARAMRAFADDGFRKLMNESGLCNHPDVVRFVLKVGKAISDDRFITGRNGGGAKLDLAHRMFPNSK